jgi:hypothetical protein
MDRDVKARTSVESNRALLSPSPVTRQILYRHMKGGHGEKGIAINIDIIRLRKFR